MTATHATLRKILAALLVVSAALFTLGVAREHSTRHDEAISSATTTATTHTETGSESGDASEHHAANPEQSAHAESTGEGTVLGVDLESWALVVVFDLISAALALALLRTRARSVVAATALVVAIASVFDVGEIVHQANESRTTLLVIATLVAMLHLIALAVAITIVSLERSPETEQLATAATR